MQTLAFDSKRYVGAQIGIYNPSGEKVGEVSRLRNLEYVVVAGSKDEVEAITAPLCRQRSGNSRSEVSVRRQLRQRRARPCPRG